MTGGAASISRIVWLNRDGEETVETVLFDGCEDQSGFSAETWLESRIATGIAWGLRYQRTED